MPNCLSTKWGRELDHSCVLPEYPRPAMVRDSYLNLNGLWDYAFTKSEEIPDRYEGKILVPFSPEAALSGVGRQLQPDEVLHYQRWFQIPGGLRQDRRWLLHFGAVDQSCHVYVNGQKAGSHTGGYLPFTLDITRLLAEGDNLLQVVVRDLSDTSYHAKGKQSLERGGMWYTAQSGIWQTVWMEETAQRYIRDLRIVPEYDQSRIEVTVVSSTGDQTAVSAEIVFQGNLVAKAEFISDQPYHIDLKRFESWTPETPDLYDMAIRMGEDEVTTYFAMRKVSVQADARGILRFYLNNRPYFHNGLLDQGYYPDGLYTAPSDEALQYDIRKMKELGFNMLRKHIKIEPQRWYYHCDRIGMLVWQDMVCGGERYHSKFVTVMPNVAPWTGRVIRDHHYRLFARMSREGREEYNRELEETIHLLQRHPSIAAWVPFNEGWGQFDANKATAAIRALDPTRLIDEASGWFDQGGGDMYSIHNYFRKLKVKPHPPRVIALTECGGYSLRIPEHSFCEEVYGYRKYGSVKELTEGIAGLWRKELIPNLSRGLSASIYTQVTDIEDELNGLLTWDREIVKVDQDAVRTINRELQEAFGKSVMQ